MPPEGVAGLRELLAAAARDKPLRTYSRRGRNAQTAAPPALKPNTDQPPPTEPSSRLQRFRIGHVKGQGVTRIGLQNVQTDLHDSVVDPETHATGRAEEAEDSAEDSEEITSPASPSGDSQASRESGGAEDQETAEDSDDPIVIFETPRDTRKKGAGHRSNHNENTRRRPFLIFDKMQPSRYKKLKPNPLPSKTPPSARSRPGDGFSSREAKPNGLNLLTRNGKPFIAGPQVGMLDLTQSAPPQKQKRSFRKANFEDNSFASTTHTKKKTRRPLEPGDPNHPAKPAQVKNSSSVLLAAPNTREEVVASEKETQLVMETETEPQGWHNAAGEPLSNDGDDEVDMIAIERSDEVQPNPSTMSKRRDSLEQGQDRMGTHVSDSPWQQLRAGSASPALSPERNNASATPGPPQRAFRRSKTQ